MTKVMIVIEDAKDGTIDISVNFDPKPKPNAEPQPGAESLALSIFDYIEKLGANNNGNH